MTAIGFGFAGTMAQEPWSRLFERHLRGSTGLAVTIGSGTRALNVATGSTAAAGILCEVTVAETVVLAANSSTTNRIDYVVLTIDWSSKSVSVGVVQGAGPTPPNVTQIPGELYQIIIRQVTVRPGVTVFATTDIGSNAAPADEVAKIYTQGVSAATLTGTSARTIATITIPDPGYRYRMVVDAVVYVGAIAAPGRVITRAVANAVELIPQGRTAIGGQSAAVINGATGLRRGDSLVTLSAEQNGNTTGSVDVFVTSSNLRVMCLPA